MSKLYKYFPIVITILVGIAFYNLYAKPYGENRELERKARAYHHVCSDTTHIECDGVCECDGMECIKLEE
jgi:hypothetical protein